MNIAFLGFFTFFLHFLYEFCIRLGGRLLRYAGEAGGECAVEFSKESSAYRV